MGFLKTPRRIRAEDFPKESQNVVGKIADSINDFYDDITFILNGRVDFTNLNRQIIVLTIDTTTGGALKSPANVRLTLKSKLIGINVINVEDLSSPNSFPPGSSNCSFTFDNNIAFIRNVTGLAANKTYRLTLEFIGN